MAESSSSLHVRVKDPSKPDTLIEQLESTAKRVIGISTAHSSDNLARCHDQAQSPLFALPAEIRGMIFGLATAPCYAPCTLYDETDLRYRPDHKGRWISSVDLLATCRRIWLEANHMPMEQGHHCFYIPNPKWEWDYPKGSTLFLERETAVAGHVESLQLTGVQRPWHGSWLGHILSYQASARLREIRFELETLASDLGANIRPLISEWTAVLAQVHRVDELGNQVCVELQPLPPERTWSGPTELDGRSHGRYQGLKRLDYRIITLVWKIKPELEKAAATPFNAEPQELPSFAFSDADREPVAKPTPESIKAIRQMEDRWEEEGSLLKFGQKALVEQGLYEVARRQAERDNPS